MPLARVSGQPRARRSSLRAPTSYAPGAIRLARLPRTRRRPELRCRPGHADADGAPPQDVTEIVASGTYERPVTGSGGKSERYEQPRYLLSHTDCESQIGGSVARRERAGEGADKGPLSLGGSGPTDQGLDDAIGDTSGGCITCAAPKGCPPTLDATAEGQHGGDCAPRRRTLRDITSLVEQAHKAHRHPLRVALDAYH